MANIQPILITEFNCNAETNPLIIYCDAIDEILLHDSVKEKKVVTLSISGDDDEHTKTILQNCVIFFHENFSCIKSSNPRNSVSGVYFWPDIFIANDTVIILIYALGLPTGVTLDESAFTIFNALAAISSIQFWSLKKIEKDNLLTYFEYITEVNEYTNTKKRSAWKPFQNFYVLFDENGEEAVETGNQTAKEDEIVKLLSKRSKNTFDIFFEKSFQGALKDTFTIFEFYSFPFMKNSEVSCDLKSLIKSILTRDHPTEKTIFGRELKAVELRNFILNYFGYINSTGFNKDTLTKSFIESQMSSIIDDQVDEYCSMIKDELNFCKYKKEDFDKLINLEQKQMKTSALEKFKNAEKIEVEEEIEKASRELERKIDEDFEFWQKIVEKKKEFNKLLRSQASELLTLKKEKDTLEQMQQLRENLMRKQNLGKEESTLQATHREKIKKYEDLEEEQRKILSKYLGPKHLLKSFKNVMKVVFPNSSADENDSDD